MPEFLQNLIKQVQDFWNKTGNIQKYTVLGVLVVVVLAFIAQGMYSSKPAKEVLFDNIKPSEYSSITKQLDALGYDYSGSGSSAIYVNGNEKQKIVTMLTQENLLPAGVEGYELFNMSKWDETTFDKNVKLRRAVKGELEKMIMTLDFIKTAQVKLAVPEQNVFRTNDLPTKASIQIRLKPGYQKPNRKQVAGMKLLVSRAIPNLQMKHVAIMDQFGRVYQDPDDLDREQRELDLVERKKQIEERERRKIMGELQNRLHTFYKADRISVVRVDFQMNWDKVKEKQKLVAPVEHTPEDPNTPYPDRKLMPNGTLILSENARKEGFRGNGFTPGGPTGTSSQLPPGYKDLDYQRSEYRNNDLIRNYDYNRITKDIVRQPWKEMGRSVSILVDGVWVRGAAEQKADGTWGFKRTYTAPSKEDIATLEKVIKTTILFKASRGDQVIVAHKQKDRTDEFRAEDEALTREKMIQRLLIVSGIALAVFVLIYLLYRAIKKEIARRRRLREEELAAQQQLMREAALRVADEGAAEVELSVDERARREMLENAMNLAREKPDQVAKLLRTWLQADE